MNDTKKNTTDNATSKAATVTGRIPALIIMPYRVAMMQSDQTRLQLEALTIAMSLLQPWLTAQLNHEMTHEEALRQLVASNGAGPDLLLFPITWQAAGLTRSRGLMAIAAATKAPNLGLRITTADDGTNGQLYMTVRMAAYLLDLSKGYFYVSPQLCHAMRSRYAVRLYWLMQAHSHQGGFTMSIGQLQATLCPRKKSDGYGHFERSVIVQPLATLQKLHAGGHLPAYMLFCRLYNRQGHRYWMSASTALHGWGTPDALKFTIIRPDNAAPAIPRATPPAEGPAKASGTEKRKSMTANAVPLPSDRSQEDIVLTLLHDDLQLPEKLAEREAARVTDSMRQAFINHAIMLKEIIDEKRSRKQALKNQVAYVLTCLHHFFEKQENRGGAAKESEGKTSGEGRTSAERADEAQPSLALKRRGTEQQPTKSEAKREAPSPSPLGRAGEGLPSPSPLGRAGEGLLNRWHLFLASYTGKATAALSRAKLNGQLRDGFLVSFATKDDEQAYRSDFDAVQQAARKVLDISCRFQPGLIVNR